MKDEGRNGVLPSQGGLPGFFEVVDGGVDDLVLAVRIAAGDDRHTLRLVDFTDPSVGQSGQQGFKLRRLLRRDLTQESRVRFAEQ